MPCAARCWATREGSCACSVGLVPPSLEMTEVRAAPFWVTAVLSCAMPPLAPSAAPSALWASQASWRRQHSLPPSRWPVGAAPAEGAERAGRWPTGHTWQRQGSRRRMCPQLAQLLREPTPAPVGRAMGQDWGVPGPSLWAWEMLMWREAAHPGVGSFQAQSLPPGPGFCAQTTAWRVEHGQACVRSNVSDALSLIIDFIPKRQRG